MAIFTRSRIKEGNNGLKVVTPNDWTLHFTNDDDGDPSDPNNWTDMDTVFDSLNYFENNVCDLEVVGENVFILNNGPDDDSKQIIRVKPDKTVDILFEEVNNNIVTEQGLSPERNKYTEMTYSPDTNDLYICWGHVLYKFSINEKDKTINESSFSEAVLVDGDLSFSVDSYFITRLSYMVNDGSLLYLVTQKNQNDEWEQTYKVYNGSSITDQLDFGTENTVDELFLIYYSKYDAFIYRPERDRDSLIMLRRSDGQKFQYFPKDLAPSTLDSNQYEIEFPVLGDSSTNEVVVIGYPCFIDADGVMYFAAIERNTDTFDEFLRFYSLNGTLSSPSVSVYPSLYNNIDESYTYPVSSFSRDSFIHKKGVEQVKMNNTFRYPDAYRN